MKLYYDKEWLIQKYFNESLTLSQIAEICSVHQNTIHIALIRFGIKRRKAGPASLSESSKKKISDSLKGKQPMLGKKHTQSTKAEMSRNRTGSGNSNWKGGVTFNSRKFRKSREYQIWRKQVLNRDNHVCQYQDCGISTSIVHHIKPVKGYPELRVEVNNGIAVCENHHKLIHKNLRNEGFKN